MEAHALPVHVKACFAVNDGNLTERGSEDPFEVVHAVVAMPELLFQGYPRYESRLRWLYPVQALRKPGVNVEPHRAVRESRHSGLIQRDSMLHEAVKVPLRELDLCGPEDALPLVFWRPEFQPTMTTQGIFSIGSVAPGLTTSADKPTKLHTAAQQFEALMIGEMMRSQREADGGGWLGTGSDDDNASESAMDIAESQFSTALASRGGLVLAQIIERTMAPTATDQPVTSANSEINTEGAR